MASIRHRERLIFAGIVRLFAILPATKDVPIDVAKNALSYYNLDIWRREAVRV